MQQHQVGKNVDKPEDSYVVGAHVKWYYHFGKSLRSFFLNKTKNVFIYRPAISLQKSTQKK